MKKLAVFSEVRLKGVISPACIRSSKEKEPKEYCDYNRGLFMITT